MEIEDEIQSLTKLEIKLRDDYLNRIVDFLKWSTTIALAAGLWIGANLSRYLESSKLIQLIFFTSSFGCEILSILIAVIAIYTVIGLWDLELKYIGKITPIIDFFHKNRDESVTDDELSKQIKEIKTVHINLAYVEKINLYFKFHVMFLVIGILLFYFAIILQ